MRSATVVRRGEPNAAPGTAAIGAAAVGLHLHFVEGLGAQASELARGGGGVGANGGPTSIRVGVDGIIDTKIVDEKEIFCIIRMADGDIASLSGVGT